MKYKIIKDKKTGDSRIDYYKVKDKTEFRFETLSKIISDKKVIIRVDTNLIESEQTEIEKSKEIEQCLIDNDFSYEILPTEKTKGRKIFGFKLKKEAENAYNIIFEIKWGEIPLEIFIKYFASVDLDIGIEPKIPLNEIYKEMQKGYLSFFFDSEHFESSIYDSRFIGSMRMSKDLDFHN